MGGVAGRLGDGQVIATGMLTSCPVIAFSVTRDADRALAFYRDVLGLTLTEDGPYALVFDANGTMVRVQKVGDYTPHPFTQIGWRVADISATAAGLAARGVVFERYPFLDQDGGGVWASPDGQAKVAWFKDPDGNLISLTEWR